MSAISWGAERWTAVKVAARRCCWRAPQPIFADGIWEIIRESQPELLPVCIIDRGDDHDEATREKAAEVAHMIAAAPELFEIADQLASVLTGVLRLGMMDMDQAEFIAFLDREYPCIRKANGIIAKARGEAPHA